MNIEQPTTEAADDDDVVDPFPVVAKILGFSPSTLRRLIAKGKGPPVVELSDRRQGVMRRHRRSWAASRTRWPVPSDDGTSSPSANSRNYESSTSMELRR
jgi:hypothetical protein